MIRIQETPSAGPILTLIKPVGREIPVRIGEIIEAQVVDLFPSGGLTLKVKGGYLPARTNLAFEKNDTLSLKVLDWKGAAGELRLQLLDNKTGAGEANRTQSFPGDENERIEDLTRKAADRIINLFNARAEEGQPPESIPSGKQRDLLGSLFKTLPSDIKVLPKSLRDEIQHVLQTSLKGPGLDITERLTQLFQLAKEEISSPPLLQNLQEKLLVSMDGLAFDQLKNALENSGIVLEAKLKAMAGSGALGGKDVFQIESKINKDIKGFLLQLQEILEQKTMGEAERGRQGTAHPDEKTLGGVETLLKDIETFQLLSKISDSFYTFLPVQWAELKRGELIFKRRTAPSGGTSYSCGIHLELEKLGPVSAFIFMQDRDFSLTFKVGHPGLNTIIHSCLGELKENFNRAGLNLKNFTFLRESEEMEDPINRIETDETIVSIRV
ncbi:MAG: flagellar hook-length control protein FliK [Deltaproteobacteria bacterium]|nr:flagellar hook-length control protein FliK [Deltaproteobacteria bacterium]